MIRIRSKIIETRPPEVSIRNWRRITRDAHAEMGALWHREMLPKHFQQNARAIYKHKVRSKKWTSRKRALARRGRLGNGRAVQKGGLVDNVFTGLLEDSLKSSATIRAFPSRVTIRMNGPRYISMRPFHSNQPDKAAEITTTTKAEAIQLAKVLNQSTTNALKALRAPKTTTN